MKTAMEFVDHITEHRQRTQAEADLQNQRLKNFTIANVGASDKDSKQYSISEKSTDDFQGLRLISRYIEQSNLDSQLQEFNCYSVGKLLAVVHPPNFTPPKDPQFVVYGIVAKRGEVRQSQSGKKYVSLLLCDLHYEILLTIYGAAFDKYYKIRPGTLIAVCNPNLYATKNLTSALAMGINCEGRPVLEIGRAKDLGQCSSEVNASKNRCKNWVNLKLTEVCEYHQELKARRAMSKRPEFNSVVSKLHDPKDKNRQMAMYTGGSVKWRQGLHYDNQAPAEPIYQSGPFREEPDHDRAVLTPAQKGKLEKKRLDRLKTEVKIRQQLAKRSDGHMLREYDKGVLKNPELYGQDSKSMEVFKGEDLKKIGFNPSLAKQSAPKRARKSTPQVVLQPPQDPDDEDSDLEII